MSSVKGFGRQYKEDVRDRNHLMAERLGADIVRPSTKHWTLNWHGDQGDTPMCVGYGWHGLLRALPLLQRDPIPSVIYHEAQLNDEFRGENYDGSSVRGGAKALRLDGKIQAYAWAFDIETVLNWIGLRGPVVFGTDWKTAMFNPDPSGLVELGGIVEGGHCYLAIGYDDRRKLIYFQNSWGTHWGLHGRFNMHYEDADALIQAQGEACTPVEAAVVATHVEELKVGTLEPVMPAPVSGTLTETTVVPVLDVNLSNTAETGEKPLETEKNNDTKTEGSTDDPSKMVLGSSN